MTAALAKPDHGHQLAVAALVPILVGTLAALVGAMIAVLWGANALFFFSLTIASPVIIANYRTGIWLLVFLLPFASTELVPRKVFEVTGFNLTNGLLALTLLSLFMVWILKQETIRPVYPPGAFMLYIGMIAFAALVGARSVRFAITIPGASDGPLTITTYLLDNFFKPLIILITAWLAAVFARNGDARALIWALAFAFATLFLVIVGHIKLNDIELQTLAAPEARDFLNWTGMHANEVGLLANLGLAILLYAGLATSSLLARVILLLCAASAATVAALTFSRGAFLGLIIISGYYLLTRRHATGRVLAVCTIGVLLSILPGAFVDRATTGIQTTDTEAITSGRLNEIWLPLLPTFWEAPIIGHGLRSTLWATPNLNGTMLLVGHPHSAYLALLLDFGIIGIVIVSVFFWSTWLMFRRLARYHHDPQWRGVFEGSAICLLCLAAQGLTDDQFIPGYTQVPLWLCYGLAWGHSRHVRLGNGPQS
jgi:hypothetical protein